jgi:hypothetical protein
MTINGVKRSGVRVFVQDGEVRVSPSVIAALMAERYGEVIAGDEELKLLNLRWRELLARFKGGPQTTTA